MKVSVYKQYGSPDVINIVEIPMPVAKDDEILVQVFATTVNRTDCAMLRAKPFIMRLFTGLFAPRRKTLGTDFSGKVIAIGKDVTSFNVGDNVFGFDGTGAGTHAQFASIPQHKAVAVMPAGITYDEAAASLEGVHYAYNMFNKIQLNAGDRVLVNGASGAIGSAAVQLLKYFNTHVTAVCSTATVDIIRSWGADKVIDYRKEDFTASGEKYKYIFDAVGKSTFGKCGPLLEPMGAYVFSEPGPWGQNIFLSITTSFRRGKKVIFPIPVNGRRTISFISKLIAEGKFKPLIDRRYPLEQIADAFRYVETGEKAGNVIVNYQHE